MRTVQLFLLMLMPLWALNFEYAQELLGVMGDAPFGFTAPMIYDIENDGSQELIVGIMSDGSAYTVEGHVLVFENSGTTASPQYQLPDDGGYSYTRLQVAGQPLTLEAST